MKRMIVSATATLALASHAHAADFDPGFDGAWIGTIKFLDSSQYEPMPLPDEARNPRPFEVAIEIYEGSTRVFVNASKGWHEVKPGAFKLETHRTNAVVFAIDSNLNDDESAGWVETWNFTLTHKDDGSLYAYWVRAVNNYHVPAMTDPNARFFFSGFGELTEAPPIAGPGRISVSQTLSAPKICLRSQIDCRWEQEPKRAPHE